MPFRYLDKGALAVVGTRQGDLRDPRPRAVRPARLLHLPDGAHVLPQRRRSGHRLKVLIDWISSTLGDPQDQVIDGELESIRTPPGARA